MSMQVTARYMDFANWLLAWARYSLAAVMTKQLTFNASQQYLSVITEVSLFGCRQCCVHARTGLVLQIAAESLTKCRQPLLAVLYDSLARCVFLGAAAALSMKRFCI